MWQLLIFWPILVQMSHIYIQYINNIVLILLSFENLPLATQFWLLVMYVNTIQAELFICDSESSSIAAEKEARTHWKFCAYAYRQAHWFYIHSVHVLYFCHCGNLYLILASREIALSNFHKLLCSGDVNSRITKYK